MLRRNPAVRRLPHLLHPAGDAALAAVLRRGPVLAFDFDGTLAPTVARPDRARISQCVAGKLQQLAGCLPVAVVTGRSADDVRRRLRFEPACILGNHGAEAGAEGSDGSALDGLRQVLQARRHELAAAGVTVEDKCLSLALHYRLSRRPEQALALIRDAVRSVGDSCRAFAGKRVENVVPAQAPDLRAALHGLVLRCGRPCALFVGEDAAAEPVFASAPSDWLTVRIGRTDAASAADYFLDSAVEVGLLLDRMLVHLALPA